MTRDECPCTQRSGGTSESVAMLHRIAVANRFAIACKPLIDDLRKGFPNHPAVLAFDEYADATLDSEIRRALLEAER